MKISKSILTFFFGLVILCGGYFLYSSLQQPNDLEAQYQLAYRYEHGNGVPKDSKKACELYQNAANQGLAKAQNSLGACYETGSGVEQNLEQAIHWYEKAAEKDYIFAQMNLGEFYHKKGDYQNALLWFSKAADLGAPKAQSFLGCMYEYGQGTEPDHAKSLEFYKQAAEQGNAEAQFNLGRYYMSEAGGNNYSEAANWYTKASNQDLPEAHYNLAVMYDRDRGEVKNMKLAGELYRKAAAGGVSDAQKLLEDTASFCFAGEEVTKERFDACLVAASAGFSDAQKNLVTYYYKGAGTPKNSIESFAWGFTYLASTPRGEVNISDHKAVAAATALMLNEMKEPDQAKAKEQAKEYVQRYKAD